MTAVKIFLGVWAAVVITTLTVFGLCKLGGNLFDVNQHAPNASGTIDGETCWSKGGVPQYDTRGTEDDFMDCKFPGGK